MEASTVIGQSNFTSSSSGPTQLSPTNPQDVIIVNNKLILADQGNNRVLIWNQVPTQNGTPADVVLGQPDFSSNTANNGGRSASTLNTPSSVSSDGTRLFVADRGNNRILIWNTIPTSNQALADIVVGQTNFSNGSNNCTVSTLNAPESVFTDGTRMFIADASNSRVLIFNQIPTVNTPSASLVLGQPNFTTCIPNNGGASAKSMQYINGIFYDGGKLFVAEETNNRILIWNSLPSENFALADIVVGQPDFTSISAN
jgi:hypothetical protein